MNSSLERSSERYGPAQLGGGAFGSHQRYERFEGQQAAACGPGACRAPGAGCAARDEGARRLAGSLRCYLGLSSRLLFGVVVSIWAREIAKGDPPQGALDLTVEGLRSSHGMSPSRRARHRARGARHESSIRGNTRNASGCGNTHPRASRQALLDQRIPLIMARLPRLCNDEAAESTGKCRRTIVARDEADLRLTSFAMLRPGRSRWARKLYLVIFEADTPAGKAFDVALLLAILVGLLVVSLDSVTAIAATHGRLLARVEWVLSVLFSIEYRLAPGVPAKPAALRVQLLRPGRSAQPAADVHGPLLARGKVSRRHPLVPVAEDISRPQVGSLRSLGRHASAVLGSVHAMAPPDVKRTAANDRKPSRSRRYPER